MKTIPKFFKRLFRSSPPPVFLLLLTFFSSQLSAQSCACTDFPTYKCITSTGSTTLTTLIASGDLLDYVPALSTPQKIVVFGDINFMDPGNPNQYTFAPGSEIIMRPNTTLSIRKDVLFDGTTIVGCDLSNLWGGIQVFNGGIISIRGSRVIGACTGLRLNTGSNVEVTGSRFTNNWYGIWAAPTAGGIALHGDGIANTVFEVPAVIANCQPPNPSKGIFLENVPFLQIGNASVSGPNIFSTPVGIDAVNSNFALENSKFQNRPNGTAMRMQGNGSVYTATVTGLGVLPGNEFINNYGLGISANNYHLTLKKGWINNFQLGVSYYNSLLPSGLYVDGNQFTNILSAGIELKTSSFSSVKVLNNVFIDDSKDTMSTSRVGVKWTGSTMAGTRRAVIENNIFKDEQKPISSTGFIDYLFIGVNITNSTSNIDLFKNSFYQNYTSTTMHHSFAGVQAFNASNINLEDNGVFGADLAAAGDDLRGFYFVESGDNTFQCNQAEKLKAGIEFSGPACDQTILRHSRMENNLTGLRLNTGATIIGPQIKNENRWIGALPSAGVAEAHFDFGGSPPFLPALLMSEFQINDPNPTSDYWANPRNPVNNWFVPNADPPIFQECAKVVDPGEDPKSRAQKAAIDSEFPNYRNYEASGWEMDLMAFGVLSKHPELLEEGTPDLTFYQTHENGNLAKLWNAYSDWNGLQQTSSELESALETNQETLEAAIVTLKEVYNSGVSDEMLETITGIEAEIAALVETNAALHSTYQTETNARLEQLQSDLDAIEPANVWETNLKTVLGLRAEKLLSESADWNDEQRETLQQIADQCRYEGGIGVVLARAELDKATKYNDEEMCPDLAQERAARVSTHTAVVTPNPARDYCQILLSDAQEARIELYDLQGRILYGRNVSGSLVVHVDISNLASGMYLLQVRTPKGKEAHKLFVTR